MRKYGTIPSKYDKRRYKRRNRIKIVLGRIKDWRRVATRFDRTLSSPPSPSPLPSTSGSNQ